MQDLVLTGGLGVSKVAFACHWIPPCLLGATPTDPDMRDYRIRFLRSTGSLRDVGSSGTPQGLVGGSAPGAMYTSPSASERGGNGD